MKYLPLKLGIGILLVFGILITGCASVAPDSDEREYPMSDDLINEPFLIEFITVNNLEIPEKSVDASLKTILKHVRGPITRVKGENVNIEVPDDGFITWEQMSGILAKRRHNGRSVITAVTLPKMRYANRGFCQYMNDGSHLVVLYAEPIESDANIFVPVDKVYELVFTHEIGHALGVPYRKSHKWSGNHCTNPHCIMYPRPDFRAILTAVFHLGAYDDFCEECAGELAEFRLKVKQMTSEEKESK
jgi:hypothetical protein